jgi:hypothetical protein
MIPNYAIVFVTLLAVLQDKPATPAVPFDQIVGCVKAQNCKNMQYGAINWFDVVNISVIGFKDESGAYALSVSRDGALSIWITPPGETTPSRHVSVAPENTVLSGGLGPMPGDIPPPAQMTPEQTAQSRIKHKDFLSPKLNRPYGAWGEEFRTFWEAQASQALAAIRRQISKP